MAVVLRYVAVLAAMALSACGAKENPARADAEPTAQSVGAIDPAALKIVSESVDSGVNTVPTHLHGMLGQAAQLRTFRIEQFAIDDEAGLAPFDGWLAERGFLTFVGEEYGQVYGQVTEAAFAVAVPDDAIWLKAGPGKADSVECKPGRTLNDTSCTLGVTYLISPTEAGKHALGALNPFSIRIIAQVRQSSAGWTVETIEGSNRSLSSLVIDQLVGPPDQRASRREAALAKWRAASTPSEPAATVADPELQ